MKILILGATGTTGQQLVKQALEQNHFVTALARNPSKLKITHERLKVIKGDALDNAAVLNALEGNDAVLSALGKGYTLRSGNLMSEAISILIPAMQTKKINRLVFLSAFGVGESFAGASFIQKIIFRTFLRNIYKDKANAEIKIRNSQLAWTIVYPGILTNGPITGKYFIGENVHMKGQPKISRADVADFMLKHLSDNTYLHKFPVIINQG
jgi:putative NADH-flavin reductase